MSLLQIFNKPVIQILNSSQIKQIHEATLDILANTGVRIQHPKGIEYLADAGARVEKDRIYFSSELVASFLKPVSSSVVIGYRNAYDSIELEGDTTWYGPCLDCLDYLDPETNERRRYSSDDCRVSAIVADALPHFTWVMTLGLADDISPEYSDRVNAKQALLNCRKPLSFCSQGVYSDKDIYEMALMISGSEKQFQQTPNILSIISPNSPLSLSTVTVDRILFAVEKSIPLVILPALSAGSTSPVSLAGTIAQANAESLAGLALTQILKPGFPVLYGAMPSIMDMATSIFSYGAPELSIMSAAFCQIAKIYGMPSFGTGGCSDAKQVDIQAAVEATYSLLSSGISGVNMVHDCGILDHGSLASPGYNVLISEIVGMVKQFEAGIEVSDDTLALDVIHNVGPGGHYLQEGHTFNNFKDVWYPKLFDRSSAVQNSVDPSNNFNRRLKQKILKALEHSPDPLPDEVVSEIETLSKDWK